MFNKFYNKYSKLYNILEILLIKFKPIKLKNSKNLQVSNLNNDSYQFNN
jgi:hypothetical protein